jgi:hypothetical protein
MIQMYNDKPLGNMAVLKIMFTSTATRQLGCIEIAALCDLSENNNRCNEVSRLLLIGSGSYLQVIEGPERSSMMRLSASYRLAAMRPIRAEHTHHHAAIIRTMGDGLLPLPERARRTAYPYQAAAIVSDLFNAKDNY